MFCEIYTQFTIAWSEQSGLENPARASRLAACRVVVPTRAKTLLFSSSRPSAKLSWTVPTGSITSHTPLTNPAPRGRVIHSHMVTRSRRCDRRLIALCPSACISIGQDCNPHVQIRVGTGTCECMEHLKRCTHESRTSPATDSAECPVKAHDDVQMRGAPRARR